MIVSRDRLFHYFMQDPVDLVSIFSEGLLPLSERHWTERWRRMERVRPGFFEQIYREFTAGVLDGTYVHSGVFFTPVDFTTLPEFSLARRPRIAVPVGEVDSALAVLTHAPAGRRQNLPLTREALDMVARIWTPELLQEWFGKDKTMMFYYVPQVAIYQKEPVVVRAEWLEGADPPRVRVRRAGPQDAPDICRVHGRSVRRLLAQAYGEKTVEGWAAALTPEMYVESMTGGERLFLAEVDGQMVGFGGRRDDEVTAVYVDPEHVGQGVGTALLGAVERDARREGRSELHLSSTVPASRFYESAGFSAGAAKTHRLRSGAWVDVVEMRKDLA